MCICVCQHRKYNISNYSISFGFHSQVADLGSHVNDNSFVVALLLVYPAVLLAVPLLDALGILDTTVDPYTRIASSFSSSNAS